MGARLGSARSSTIPELQLARFGDPQRSDFENLPAANHALDGESDTHQLRQLVGREAVGAHDCLGAALSAAASEQRERAPLVGLRCTFAAALMAKGRHRGGRITGAVAPLYARRYRAKTGSTCSSGYYWDTQRIIH